MSINNIIRRKRGKYNKAFTITWGANWYNIKSKWDIVDCSKYKSRIEQTPIYVQVISSTRWISAEHEVVIVTRSFSSKTLTEDWNRRNPLWKTKLDRSKLYHKRLSTCRTWTEDNITVKDEL